MSELVDQAVARADARAAATPRVDYSALNKMIRRQRAALTRAKNTGDVDKVAQTVQAAVREWNQPGAIWPDDWSTWERTLNDMLPWNKAVDIRDLA